MNSINRLSDCKNINDFNHFSSQLKLAGKNNGRLVVYTDSSGVGHTYTRNQITSKFTDCINKSKSQLKKSSSSDIQDHWHDFRIQVEESLQDLNKLNKVSKEIPSTKAYKVNKTIGNIWYSVTHLGPNKKVQLKSIQNSYVDVYANVAKKVVKTSPRLWQKAIKASESQEEALELYGLSIEKAFESNNCLFYNVLEDEKALSFLLKDEHLRVFTSHYAQKNDLSKVSESHLAFIIKKTLKDDGQKLIDKWMAESTPRSSSLVNHVKDFLNKNGHTLEELLENRSLVKELGEMYPQINTALKLHDLEQSPPKRFAEIAQEAVHLGLEHARKGKHIYEILGLNSTSREEEDIKKAAYEIVQSYDPSSHSIGDEDLYAEALTIFKIIAAGCYHRYNSSYQTMRGFQL